MYRGFVLAAARYILYKKKITQIKSEKENIRYISSAVANIV